MVVVALFWGTGVQETPAVADQAEIAHLAVLGYMYLTCILYLAVFSLSFYCCDKRQTGKD